MSDETAGWVPPREPGQTMRVPPSYTDAAGMIDRDLTCRRCGYNLRGLREEGRCPECGSAVGLSTRGDLLQFADPNWVSNLARGGRLVMRGLTIAILAILVSVCGGAAFGAATAGAEPAVFSVVVLLMQLVVIGAMLAAYYGIWLITSPDPSRIGADVSITTRQLARIGILAWLLSTALEIIESEGTWSPTVVSVFQVLNVLCSLMFLVGWLAYLRYAGVLAGRIPDELLVQRARLLFRLHIALFVLVVLLAALTVVVVAAAAGTGAPGGPGLAFAAVPLTCGVIVGVLVIFLMYVRFQHRLGKAFEEQAAYARDTWASERDGQPSAGPIQ